MSAGIKGIGKWDNGGIIKYGDDIKLLEHQPRASNVTLCTSMPSQSEACAPASL